MMPFAVEDEQESTFAGGTTASPSPAAAGVSSSSLLASFAQKCTVPSHRLKMFEHQQPQPAQASSSRDATNAASSLATDSNIYGNNKAATAAAAADMVMSSLADQLAEFHSFGNSIMVTSSSISQQHHYAASAAGATRQNVTMAAANEPGGLGLSSSSSSTPPPISART